VRVVQVRVVQAAQLALQLVAAATKTRVFDALGCEAAEAPVRSHRLRCYSFVFRDL
jgi:hypothetical protein